MAVTRKWVWLEEYAGCGCSNVTLARKDAIGYCPRHATERRRIIKVPYMEPGFAGAA